MGWSVWHAVYLLGFAGTGAWEQMRARKSPEAMASGLGLLWWAGLGNGVQMAPELVSDDAMDQLAADAVLGGNLRVADASWAV